MHQPPDCLGKWCLIQGVCSPLPVPAQVVSNEEFVLPPQIKAQQQVETIALATAERLRRGSALHGGSSCNSPVRRLRSSLR